MAAKHFTLTLNGAAQRLNTVLPAADQTPGGINDLACRQIIFAQDPANANAIFISDDSTISSSDFGFSLDPTEATAYDKVSIGPFPDGPVKLSQFWALGTNTQKLHLLVVYY